MFISIWFVIHQPIVKSAHFYGCYVPRVRVCGLIFCCLLNKLLVLALTVAHKCHRPAIKSMFHVSSIHFNRFIFHDCFVFLFIGQLRHEYNFQTTSKCTRITQNEFHCYRKWWVVGAINRLVIGLFSFLISAVWTLYARFPNKIEFNFFHKHNKYSNRIPSVSCPFNRIPLNILSIQRGSMSEFIY